jgi:hypothetical protein
VVGACGQRLLHLTGPPDRVDNGSAAAAGDRHSGPADRARRTGDHDRLTGDRAVGKDRPVAGNARDPQQRALLQRYLVGERHRVGGRDGDVLGGGAERAVGLGQEHPDPLPDPVRAGPRPDGVDHPGAVSVGDHPGEGHGGAPPAPPLAQVARVDPRDRHPHSDLAGTRPGVGTSPTCSTWRAGPCRS